MNVANCDLAAHGLMESSGVPVSRTENIWRECTSLNPWSGHGCPLEPVAVRNIVDVQDCTLERVENSCVFISKIAAVVPGKAECDRRFIVL